MPYTAHDFWTDYAAYEAGFTFATLEDAEEAACGWLEVEADLATERALLVHLENQGYDEARFQEQMEAARGIF